MIITRTPYRVSFFGGGTDYHSWYQEHGGCVLSTSINHYCYLTVRYLLPFFSEKSRIVWSKIEKVMDNSEIEHPAVNAILKELSIDNGIEIHHSGDLPARSGLGSSSAFTVGLLNAIFAMQGRMSNKKELACEAVHIERHVLKENVGVQDQIATAYGGFNKISIESNGDFSVHPVILSQPRMEELQSHFMLFFTGVSRTASTIAKDQLAAIKDKQKQLHEMAGMVDEAIGILNSQQDITDFGRLLHETWQLKRSLSSSVSPEFIDDIYERARDAGAIGGKLLGAGGGGFMLFFAKPEHHLQIMNALKDLLWVPFEFENEGSRVMLYEPAPYSHTSLQRRDFYHLQQQIMPEPKKIVKPRRTRLSLVS